MKKRFLLGLSVGMAILPAFATRAVDNIKLPLKDHIQTKAPRPAQIASEITPPIIEEQPEGDVTWYKRNAVSFYTEGWNLVFGEVEGAAKVVYGTDGNVYIYNPIAGMKTGAYLKCTQEGNKLTATLPQKIYKEVYYDEENPIYYYATLLKQERTESGLEYVEVEPDGNSTISWTIEGDQLRLDLDYTPTFDEEGYLNYPTGQLFGIVDGSWGYWNGTGDCLQTYVPVELNPVTPPADMEFENWTLSSKESAKYISVGFKDNEVYIQGLFSSIPEVYMKGEIEGHQIVFKSCQYMGMVKDEFIYLMGATYDMTDFYLEDKVACEYDRELQKIIAAAGSAFLMNASTERLKYLDVIMDPTFKVTNPDPDPTPQVPKPIIWAFGSMEFLMPYTNLNDDILDTSTMYYEIYLDDELFTFTPDVYDDLENDMTQIPYNFNLKWCVESDGMYRKVYFFKSGFETIGCRMYNVKDGVTYHSPLLRVNIKESTWEIIEDEEEPEPYFILDPESGSTVSRIPDMHFKFYNCAEAMLVTSKTKEIEVRYMGDVVALEMVAEYDFDEATIYPALMNTPGEYTISFPEGYIRYFTEDYSIINAPAFTIAYIVDTEDGLSEITVGENGAEYYDLLGRLVDNPSEGQMVIRRQNGKIEKIIF